MLDYIAEHDLVSQARDRGEYLRNRLEELEQIDIVGDVRGRGMFYGIEFVQDKETRCPFPADARLTERLVQRAYEKGLVVIGGMAGCADGVDGDHLQISPAYVITEEQIDRAVGMLRESIEQVRDELL